MKRDELIIANAKSVMANPNLSEDENNAISTLIAAYESVTYKDWEDRHEFYRNIVDKMVNDMSFESEKLAEFMANNHPTLQQTYMKHCQHFIKAMSGKTYTDARNEYAVRLARELQKMSENYALPMI